MKSEAKPIYDFVNKELGDLFRENDNRAMEKGGPYMNEEEVTFASDGHKEILETIKTPMRDHNGELIGILGIARNITDRKEAEEKLRASEERFRFAGKVSFDLIYEWNPLTDSLKWFGDIDNFLGYDKGYISDNINAWLELIHPDDIGLMAEAVKIHKISTDPIKYEYRIKNKNGEYRHFNDHGLPILDKNGKPIKWIGVCTDVTDKKLAENELKKNQKRYKKAQSMGHVGNWEYNPVTQKFWGSDEARKIYGFEQDSEEFTIDEVENCIPERERVHQALIDLLESDKIYDLEFDIITYDKGIRKTIQSIADVERDEFGNPY